MRDRVRATFLKDVDWREREAALHWVFCHVADPVSFELCSEALGARSVVIRKRLMYEFYRRWIVFPSPLPFIAASLPEDFGSIVHYYCGDAGLAIAVTVWYWPGIPTAQLLDAPNAHITESDLDRTEATGIIACNADNWYVTGRRQMIEKDGPGVHWVQSIYS